MTAGTILVVMCVWVALAAWRDWPGPLDVLRRLNPIRRHTVAADPRGTRADVTVRPSRLHEIEGRTVRPSMGRCPGCGAADDEWCRADCQMIDLKDYR